MLFNYYKKKSGWDNAPELIHTHAHTLNSWVCIVSLFLPGKGLSENLRGRQEGTRWRPLQIWLLLTVLWSAHVYLLSQHWYLGLLGAWDAGPRPLWSEVDPSDYALGNCTFSLLWPSFFLFFFSFSFSPRWDLEDADGELLTWLYASSRLCSDLNQIKLQEVKYVHYF